MAHSKWLPSPMCQIGRPGSPCTSDSGASAVPAFQSAVPHARCSIRQRRMSASGDAFARSRMNGPTDKHYSCRCGATAPAENRGSFDSVHVSPGIRSESRRRDGRLPRASLLVNATMVAFRGVIEPEPQLAALVGLQLSRNYSMRFSSMDNTSTTRCRRQESDFRIETIARDRASRFFATPSSRGKSNP